MSTGVTPKQTLALQKMTTGEFAEVLFVLATLPFGGAGAESGFFARLARAGYLKVVASTQLKTLLVGIVIAFFKKALDGGLDSAYIRGAIINEIEKSTGLVLETLDKEGAKKAVGKLLAEQINIKYGTSFAPFYPLENIIEQLKQELLAEILNKVS